MPGIRSACWTFLAAGGFALLPGTSPVAARQPGKDDLPKSPPTGEISNFKTAPGIPAGDLKRAKDAFAALAKYNVEYVTHPRVYSAPQEFAPVVVKGVPIKTVDDLITDLSRHVLVPLPPPQSQVGPDHADYIRELGAALDAGLKVVIETNDDRIVRVNATRLLASACRSGATAHYPTVTALIAEPATPTEVRYYAFQAAANLLAAYDLNDYRSRKHSAPPKEVAALIEALQTAVVKPAGGGNLQALGEEQLRVIGFVRRQAVRALGQVRFAEFQVGKGPSVYPAFTLARVAASDPALAPAPGPAEIADAIAGICNMTPPTLPVGSAEQYAYAMTDAIATGLVAFATPRAANRDDKTLAWRGTAARLGDALKLWRALYDPNFNPAQPGAYSAALVPKPVSDLLLEADRRVLAPMDGTAAKIDADGLRDVFRGGLRADKKWTLAPFRGDPKLVLPKKD